MSKLKNKKIAIIHDFLIELGGAEKVLLDLLELYPQADLFTLFYDQKKLGQVFDKFNPQTTYLQKMPRFTRGAYLRALSPSAIESLDLSKYDLIISNNNSFSKGVISPPGAVHVCYCHSPTRYLWDYSHQYAKEHNLNGFKGIFVKPILSYLRVWDRTASKRVDGYIANSRNVQKRIDKYYRMPSRIVYPGTETKKYSHDQRGDYFLIVSRLSKYKKIELAVKAFNRLNRKLVIIGAGPERKHLQSIAKPNIKLLGFKSDEVVQSYYSRARAFIFPQEEDFGLTPIEAMASGVPVIAYKKGGALETIVENKTGMFFKDQTVDSLIEAVEKFVEQENNFKTTEIQAQAEKFSDKAFGKEFNQAVKEIINENG